MATRQNKSNVGVEVAMIGIAWERVDLIKKHAVESWLAETFGSPTPTTWYLDWDYDLLGLVMNEEIAVLYYLKWP